MAGKLLLKLSAKVLHLPDDLSWQKSLNGSFGAKVITDDKWLSFAVGQVLPNALKYIPSGSVHIYLEAPKALCMHVKKGTKAL